MPMPSKNIRNLKTKVAKGLKFKHIRKYDTPDGYPADICIFTLISKEKSDKRKGVPDQELGILLIQRDPSSKEPFAGQYALPGGFSERNESIDDAARRELEEETGIGEHIFLKQWGTIYYPGRDPRGWIPSTIYYALVPERLTQGLKAGTDASKAELFSFKEAMDMGLAFDHKEILEKVYAQVCKDILETTIAKEFLPKEFTLTQLYKTILAVVPEFAKHKSNFKRDIKSRIKAGLLAPAIKSDGEQKETTEFSQTPAPLYQYADNFQFTLSIYNNPFNREDQ